MVHFRADMIQGLKNLAVHKAAQDADPSRYLSIEDMRKHLSELTSSKYQRM